MTTAINTLGSDRGVLADSGGVIAEYWRPFSWSAIVGGTVTALGVQIIFALLGVGVGAALGAPREAATSESPYPALELGIGAVVWLVLSGIISFGAGGWVAGRMSGYLRTGTGAMHGVASWALAAVLGAAITAAAGAPVLGGAAAGAGAYSSRFQAQGEASIGGRIQELEGAQSMTAAEFQARTEEARRATAKVALWTGAAFVLSMIASGVGGALGRKSPERLVAKRA